MKDGTKIHNLFVFVFDFSYFFWASSEILNFYQKICIQLVHINGQDTLVNKKGICYRLYPPGN